MLIEITTSILIGILGYFISKHAINPGQILSFYGVAIGKIADSGKFGSYIANPLGFCVKCTAGMISLIYFINFEVITSKESLITTMCFVALSGYTALISDKLNI